MGIDIRKTQVAIFIAAAVIASTLVSAGALAATSDGHSRIITKKQYGKRWPFTVSRGLLTCSTDAEAVTFTARGTTYAVNGTARTLHLGRPIEPIWKKSNDPLGGPRVNIGPVLDRGLSLCA